MSTWPWEADQEPQRHICNLGSEFLLYAAIAGAVIAAAGTGVSIAASVAQRKRQEQLDNLVAEQKTTESHIIQQNAQFEETQARRAQSLILGKQQAITAASGIDPGYGSPLLQEIDLVTQGELEALTIRRAGKIASSERDFEAWVAQYRGQQEKAAIPYTIAGGTLQAAGTLGSLAGSYATTRKGTTLSSWTD